MASERSWTGGAEQDGPGGEMHDQDGAGGSSGQQGCGAGSREHHGYRKKDREQQGYGDRGREQQARRGVEGQRDDRWQGGGQADDRWEGGQEGDVVAETSGYAFPAHTHDGPRRASGQQEPVVNGHERQGVRLMQQEAVAGSRPYVCAVCGLSALFTPVQALQHRRSHV